MSAPIQDSYCCKNPSMYCIVPYNPWIQDILSNNATMPVHPSAANHYFRKSNKIIMNFNQQFKAFDPQSGDVPFHPFSTLPAIAWRARVLLRSLTTEQIESMAKRIDSEIHEYFRHLKDDAISRLQSALEGGNKANEKYFERDNDAQANGRWLFKDEMVSELDILTAENSSEVDALRAVIEMRDYRGHTKIALPIPKRYPEGNDYQLFAVQSLWLLADALNILSKKRADLSVAGDYALKAMDAVCYSEHLYEAAWLMSYTEKEKDKEWLRIDTERRRKEKSDRAKELNIARHKETYKAKELVIEEWKRLEPTGISPPRAGNKLSKWLESQSLSYEPTTITNWIRAYKKEIAAK